MPEGDTVRRTAAGLHRALAGRTLTGSELRWGELGGIDLAGRDVIGAHAYGKHLFLRIASPDTSATPDAVGRSGGVRRAEPAGRSGGVRRADRVGRSGSVRRADPVGRSGSVRSGEGRPSRFPTVTDRPLTLHSHLRMDGSWRIQATGAALPAATEHIRAVLRTAEWTAVGVLLGMLDLVPTDDENQFTERLGPDIMADDWDTSGRAEAIGRFEAEPDRWVGGVLLDQTVAAGIGTFYMAEALFVHRVSPWTPAGELNGGEVLDTARRLLLRGVQQAVPSTTGSTRRHENSYVHARSGRACRRCGNLVRVAPVQVKPYERPAFYCATCQPGPTPTDSGRPAQPLGSVPHRFGSRRNVGLGPPRVPRDR